MGPLVIKDGGNTVLNNTAGPYLEGDSPFLVCELPSYEYNVTLTWLRDGSAYDPQTVAERTPGGGWAASLKLGVLGRRDLLANLTCEANSSASFPVGASVTLELYLPPLTVSVQSWHKTMVAGLPHEMECTVVGSRPPSRIGWWLEHERLDAVYGDVSTDGNVSTSVAMVTPTAETSGKSLECRAENDHLPESSVSGYFVIGVPSKPTVELQLGSGLNVGRIDEGTDVYMECTVLAVPTESEVVWTRDGRELATGGSPGLLLTHRFLVIRGVNRGHRGRYTCKVATDDGEVESTPLVLRVNYAPRCKHESPLQLPVRPFDPVNVTCGVDADPPALHFSWSLNGTKGAESVASNTTSNLPFRVEDVPVTLSCRAQNSVGLQKEPCHINLLPRLLAEAAKSADGLNCSVANRTDTSFMLSCWGSRNLTHLSVEVYEAADEVSLTEKFTARSVAYIWTGKLRPATDYLVVVRAPSGPTFRTYVRTLVPAHNLKRPSGGSWFSLPIITTVACGAAIFVVVGAVLIWWERLRPTRKRRRRTDRQRELDSKPGAISSEGVS